MTEPPDSLLAQAKPSDLPPISLVERPTRGRVFTNSRRIRWGDTDPNGRLRLDAIARYLQDNSNDDTRDAGLDPTEPWVVRRTAVHLDPAPTVGRVATLSTWNSGQGRRWAERRTSITTEAGQRVEAASLWVRIDRETGVPARLTAEFHAVYDEAASGRRVGSRLRLPAPPAPSGGVGLERRRWPLRHTDLDGLGHVNNAATWEPIVDESVRLGLDPIYAELEYGDGIGPDDDVELVSQRVDIQQLLIWLCVGESVRATALVHAER